MAGECGVILKVVEPIKSFVFGVVSEYVGYIGSCEDNLCALRKSLSEVCDKKDDINKKVKEGNDRQEEITREAASWLKDVRILMENEDLKGLMYKDIQTAKFVVKMMGKRDLKRRIHEEGEMQELVVKVMKKLKEEMDESEEEMRKIVEVDYKQVAEVVVDVMKDTIDEFKKLMKDDKEMAVIATRTLMDRDLDKLTKGDREMEEIVREAGNASDEEFCQIRKDEESDALLVKIPTVGSGKNRVKEAASKLFTPLTNLVTPLGKLMDDANFKKVMPEAEGVKLGLEVIDGLLIRGRGLKKEVDDSTKQHRGCCCSSLSLCNDFHARYLISKAAEHMAKYIQDEFISKCPRDPVTLHIRTVDLKPIPTKFLKGLDSRTQLLHQILEKLNDDEVDSVGLFGMGGTGKTTLAKEASKRVIKDAFTIKVMVEVSDAPDIKRIQAAIAESIDLPLHDVDNVSQRAIRIYNRLISEKEKKILIILDNVWKKLDVDEIGIPHTCKFLITTREREVCRTMDVRDANILEVGVLSTIEARELFKSQTGNQVDGKGYKNVVERLLSKCGGLPLAIVATTNSLKDKDLSRWEKFANDLEKPISSQIGGDYRNTFSILNTSYKFIQADVKRIFFLLCSLSSIGSSASIESLMRYGIGLNLFEHVNKLSEAMDQAVTWGSELVLSSMLLEGDVKGDVKIHDIVRAFAISHAAKEEEHRFIVDGIPRWLDDETLKKCTAMSLTSKKDYSRLSGVEGCKLQILILKGDLSPNFDGLFFNGMVNLEVLSLSNMDFQPSLPESMRKLKRLRTLCLEGCKLRNIELVGELVSLLVLSLRDSFMESLPNEVGNLYKLRLLDLSECTSSKLPLIPPGLLDKLSRLEGLYLYNDRQSVLETEFGYKGTNATENNRLPYLNALEIKVARTKELPVDGQIFNGLDKFRISVGKTNLNDATLQKFCCILSLNGLGDKNKFLKTSCLGVLLNKADFLEMKSYNYVEHLVPRLDQQGFRSLRSLDLCGCNRVKCIVDGRTMNNLIAFPCLQSLRLDCLWSLEMMCKGDVSPGTFCNLQTIRLNELDRLWYGLPLVPRDVNEIFVSSCNLLKFIFMEDEEALPIELPFLKTLELSYVPCLLSLVGPKKFNSYDTLQGPQFFFDGKIVLPSLERFILISCNNVVNLWSKEIYTPGFQNLKDIKISRCEKLSSVGPPSFFSILVQLETLIIRHCEEMREVIYVEETEESETREQVIRFPQLRYLKLRELSKLESFYGGGSKLEFPKLKKLVVDLPLSMKGFAKLETSSALFHEKIDFPNLEELRVISVNDELMELWDKQSLSATLNIPPMLRKLALSSSARLRQIPSMVLGNLSSLTLAHLQDENVFSSSDSAEKDGFVSAYLKLSNLEELKVELSQSLKELFEKEDPNAIDDSLSLFCGQVKTLELNTLPSLNLIPLHLFKSIVSLTLFELEWNYLISAHVDEDSLHQLQFLSIKGCPNLEALVIDVSSHIKLPRLKKLHLWRLTSFMGISSTPKKEAGLFVPSLESLILIECHNLEHFWSGSILAPRLQDVSLSNCDNLQQFLGGNLEDTIELPSLQRVNLFACPLIKSISSGSLIAPKLRDVKLDACFELECFFPGDPDLDGDLHLPSLEVVDIGGCPKLRSFSLRRLLAPKLTQITCNGNEYSMLPYDDLNHFLEKDNVVSSTYYLCR
ncbi:uncharacterized protein LOC141637838 [Silene latifolia]|uniref:uncharacterized protein LOC141637838 n=1 Tax=Silene latifolia TaxID=37657 RepID=UPI003D785462